MCCARCPNYGTCEKGSLVDFHALTGVTFAVDFLKDNCLKDDCCPICPEYYDCVGSIDNEENSQEGGE